MEENHKYPAGWKIISDPKAMCRECEHYTILGSSDYCNKYEVNTKNNATCNSFEMFEE